MYMVDLEKAEEAEIELPKSIGSQKNQENLKKEKQKPSASASLNILKPLTV